jgi:hypothetical protein
MTLFRRVVLVFALMFWQGGFTFYSAVVVPIGADVLGSAADQAGVTRRVTVWLNVAGAVALPLWAWDLAASPALTRRRQVVRWLLWAGQVGALALLVWLHPRLDAMFSDETFRVHHRDDFRFLHRSYLWISTVQWAAALALLVGTFRAWRARDVR